MITNEWLFNPRKMAITNFIHVGIQLLFIASKFVIVKL